MAHLSRNKKAKERVKKLRKKGKQLQSYKNEPQTIEEQIQDINQQIQLNEYDLKNLFHNSNFLVEGKIRTLKEKRKKLKSKLN